MDTGERTETAGATRRADLLLAGAAAVVAAGWGVVAVTVVGFTLGSDFGLGTQADGRFSGGELARSALWVAVPCALVAWVLGFVSLRSTRGASAGGRVLSMVLWTAASPVICALAFTGWLATGSSDGGGLTAIDLGIGMSAAGVAMWCVTLAPLVVALVVRGSVEWLWLASPSGEAFGWLGCARGGRWRPLRRACLNEPRRLFVTEPLWKRTRSAFVDGEQCRRGNGN